MNSMRSRITAVKNLVFSTFRLLTQMRGVTTAITMFMIIISGKKMTFTFFFILKKKKHTNHQCARPYASGHAVKLDAAVV